MPKSYQTLEKLFAEKAATLDGLDRIAKESDPERLRRKPADGGWSAEEILEHLAIVESALIRLLASMLKKAATPRREPHPAGALIFSLDSVTGVRDQERYRTLGKYEPTGKVGVSDSLASLRSIEGTLFGLRPQLESGDLSSVRFPHWIFGPLSLGQWLAFFAYHEERHAQQVIELLERV